MPVAEEVPHVTVCFVATLTGKAFPEPPRTVGEQSSRQQHQQWDSDVAAADKDECALLQSNQVCSWPSQANRDGLQADYVNQAHQLKEPRQTAT